MRIYEKEHAACATLIGFGMHEVVLFYGDGRTGPAKRRFKDLECNKGGAICASAKKNMKFVPLLSTKRWDA